MADHFQIASWQAAIVGTIVAAVLGVVNLALGLLRQAREDKRKRAEAGFKLTDKMFSDEGVTELLFALDETSSSGKRPTQRAKQLAVDFHAHFGRGVELPDDHAQALWSCLDDLSFYLDRMEHAIECGITDFSSIEMPTGYYVHALAPYKEGLLAYLSDIGYRRGSRFLDRFESWRKGRDSKRGAAHTGVAPDVLSGRG
jgi:hypothetical protein